MTANTLIQKARWLTFCMSHTLTKSLLHFFPSSDNASAPYTASCTLSIFGEKLNAKSVSLDGARLGYPDGLRIEDAFPMLRGEGAGNIGLVVEISSSQPRLDLRSSGCVVELVSAGQSVKFWPKRVLNGGTRSLSSHADADQEIFNSLVMRDETQRAYVMLVNGTPYAKLAQIQAGNPGAVDGASGPRAQGWRVIDHNMAPWSVAEIQLEEGFFSEIAGHDCGWSLIKTAPVKAVFLKPQDMNFKAAESGAVGHASPSMSLVSGGESQGESARILEVLKNSGTAAYLILRETATHRVTSVMAMSSMSVDRGAVAGAGSEIEGLRNVEKSAEYTNVGSI